MSRKRVLTAALRLAARYHAEDRFAELQPYRDVVASVANQFGCTEDVARAVVHEAWKGLAAAEATDRAERRGRLERALEKLYRDAHRARQYGVCARIAKELSSLFGLAAPIKVEGMGTLKAGADTERTDAELDYFVANGHWPEEAPRQPKAPAPEDPLARLH